MNRSGVVTWEAFQKVLLGTLESFPDTVVIGDDGSETYLFADGRAGPGVAEREHVQSHDKAKATTG